MKEIIDSIHNANLTKTQKVIGEYILDHSDEACFMTSTEIAEQLNVSESSVIRFCRSLGFTGFMDFQKAMRKGYQDKVLSISSTVTIPAQRIAKSARFENDSDYINRHFKNAAKNLESIFINNTFDIFESAAELIISSKHKYIAASRANSCLADYFMLYLKQMLPNVELTNTTSCSPIDHICNISREDCLIMFSFPRYSSVDRITAKMAKESGAKIIIITDKPSSALAPFATILFTVPVDSNAFFNSLIAPQFVAEALLDTISHKVKGVKKRLKKIDKYLDELGNY